MDTGIGRKARQGFRTFAFTVALFTTALIMTSTTLLFTGAASGFVA